MFTRRLGRSNLQVSALGLGCWAIGGPWRRIARQAGWGEVDDRESVRAIHLALDMGVTLFDTASAYGCGHSERVLGQALAGRRDRAVIATKFGYQVDEVRRVAVPADDVAAHLRRECEDSLRRLQTDHIDLYQLHQGDYDARRTEDVRAVLEGLVEEGKILWYGWSTDHAASARAFAQGEHGTAVQHRMNLAADAPDILAVCEEMDQASLCRSPLGTGVLTGKFSPDSAFPENDTRHGWSFREGELARRLKQLHALRARFEGNPRTLAQIALGWIWRRSPRSVPIPGFKTSAQVAENVAAAAFGPLSAEEQNQVDEIFRPS